jgi:plastocyanin
MGRAALTASILGLLAAAAGGCGGGDGGGKSAAAGSQGAAARSVTVRIRSFKFMPPTVTVKAGGSVRWVNGDRAPHTASAQGGQGFDTGTLQTGAAKGVTFARAGRYPYVCQFHPFMKGTVIVE